MEDEMPNRMGLFHVRPVYNQEDDPKEIQEYNNKIENKITSFMVEKNEIACDLLTKLGLRKEEDEIEKFYKANMQELDSEKWLCTLSGKKFKAPEFVRKHIANKFGEKVEEVKLESVFFNNYIKDEKRPKLPTAAPAPKRPAPPPVAPPPTRPADPAYEEESEPQAKRSVKDRLGVAGVK